MREKFIPRLVAEASYRAVPLKFAEAVQKRLAPRIPELVRICREQGAEAFSAAWSAAVDEIEAEVLAEIRAEVAAYEVEGSA